MKKSFSQRIKIPHVFVLLTGVILFSSIMTYLVPSGNYQREERTVNNLTRTMVIPGTFTSQEKHYSLKGALIGDPVEGKASPVSLTQFFSAIPRGLEGAADIIFFIFIVGGIFNVIQKTGTITAVIQKMLDKFANSGIVLIIIMMVVIAIGGSTIGMGEELIPLVPVFLYVSSQMGYDRIFGLALVMLAADVGFAAATTNPFTVQIAQGIAEVPIGSGIGFRLIFFACIMTATLVYVIRYGTKVKNDPSKSYLAGIEYSAKDLEVERIPLRKAHLGVVICCIVIFGSILYATQNMGWWLSEMAGGFILMGMLAAWIAGLSVSETVEAFAKGAEEMVVAALVVGFAKGIQIVLMDGQIMDTLIYGAANVLQDFPKLVAAEGMLVFQSLLNFFIPSGSGQAAATMPLMAPLSDVLGISRQTAVFAFTCGDGFSNIIIPTSGVLMAMLGLAKVPYDRWLKFIGPLFLILMGISAIFIAIGVMIGF